MFSMGTRVFPHFFQGFRDHRRALLSEHRAMISLSTRDPIAGARLRKKIPRISPIF
jgi:hypothetical protein